MAVSCWRPWSNGCNVGIYHGLWLLSSLLPAVAIAACLSAMVMVQVNQLAKDLPQYQIALSEKVHSLRDVVGPLSLLNGTSTFFKNLGKELDAPDAQKSGASKATLNRSDTATKPIPVEVHEPARA